MKPLVSLALSAALVGVGAAATSIQTVSYSFTPNGQQVLNFNKFNSSLGTLTGIQITTSLTKANGSLYVDNDAPSGATGTISQTVRIDLSSLNSLLDTTFQVIGDNVAATTSYTATVGADDGDGAGFQVGTSDYDGTDFGPASALDSGNVNSQFFGQYTGNDTFNITVAGIQSVNTSAISGAAGSFTPATASGDVTVTYTYTPIPEPAGILLGGIGMLFLIRRRR